ncbi:hypothetical protein [Myroides sp. DW712]|uniref:hypothetical protein n=1 Tax=Myroides sp. DW712 TaxID=3389800 RepID=UPI003978BFBD
MKRIAGLILCLFTSTMGAQVLGVNTPTPLSTLTVDGSYSGRSREVYVANYTLTNEDYTLFYVNRSSDGTFLLPKVEDISDQNTGRVYHIKNLSPTRSVRVRSIAGQGFSSGVNLDNNQGVFELFPGDYLAVISNNNGTWSVLQYEPQRFATMAIDWSGSVPSNELHFRNLNIRAIDGIVASQNNAAYLQFKLDGRVHDVAYVRFSKAGKAKPYNVTSTFKEISTLNSEWYYMYSATGAMAISDCIYRNSIEMADITLGQGSTNQIFRIKAFVVDIDSRIPVGKKLIVSVELMN